MNVKNITKILENILGALVFLGAIMVLVVGIILAVESYLWMDEIDDIDGSLVPMIFSIFILFPFLTLASYLYGRFVIVPYEMAHGGGGQE